MRVTSVPVIDRLVAERQAELGLRYDELLIERWEDWLDDLRRDLTELSEVVSDKKWTRGDIQDQLDAAMLTLNNGPVVA